MAPYRSNQLDWFSIDSIASSRQMNQLTVALLQLTSGGNDQDANKAKGELFCRRAQVMGGDIALFPELWNVGYTPAHTWQGTNELWRAPELWPREEANANVL